MTEEENTKAEEYINEAKSYFKKNDYTMASLYLEKAVNLGHILAHHLLATLCYKGLGVEKDIDKAPTFCCDSITPAFADTSNNLIALSIYLKALSKSFIS